MQFTVTAYDGKDKDAMQRRMSVRGKHLKLAKKMVKEKKCLYAAALLDDSGEMIGSLMIVDFPSKTVIEEEWLKIEPYIIGNVWHKVEIVPCKVPDFCLDTSWINEA